MDRRFELRFFKIFQEGFQTTVFLSYGNQSTSLLCKSIDWFPYYAIPENINGTK